MGHPFLYGFLAGVWGVSKLANDRRQYAIYFDLSACQGEAGHGSVAYRRGLAAHMRNTTDPRPDPRQVSYVVCTT